MFKNKNVLVTGGTGLIGRELVEILLGNNAIVRVASLDDPMNFFKDVDFHKTDLTNYGNCVNVCSGMDYVFHVAGIKGSTKMSQTRPLDYFLPMIRFNTNMMEAAFRENVKWYLFTSSNGVYAHKDVSHEDDVWKTYPSDTDKLPGWAKRIGELQAEGYKTQYNWEKISIVRPANVYGSWDNFDLDNSMVIPSLIRKADDAGNNGTLNVWGDGTPIRDFIHAKDCARGMVFCVENKITEPLNLGTGDGVTIKDIASVIAKKFNCNLNFDASKPNGDPIRLLDMSRCFSYGFNLSMSLEEGIGSACDWYIKHKHNLNYRYNAFS